MQTKRGGEKKKAWTEKKRREISYSVLKRSEDTFKTMLLTKRDRLAKVEVEVEEEEEENCWLRN